MDAPQPDLGKSVVNRRIDLQLLFGLLRVHAVKFMTVSVDRDAAVVKSGFVDIGDGDMTAVL